jgi:hypothetical protein
MSVRYRERGFDARPGRRCSHVFANSVTEAKGIPPKVSRGTILSTYGRQARVLMDDAPLDNGKPYVSTHFAYSLCPEDQPELKGWPANWAARPQTWQERDEQIRRWYRAWPINPDLLERVVARYGPRSQWPRTRR